MKRPRLKLISLPWELEVPTLSLASLAAVTPEAFDIAIVDALRERLAVDEPTDLVGISASTPSIPWAYALADAYRARGVRVVMGGHHATAMPDEALEHADAVVVGEGEGSWQRICQEFLSAPSKVQGVYREPAPDLATLPQPRIDLMRIERYGRFSYPIIASRGCPEACSYCFSKRMTLGFRTYPISHILEQVRRRPSFVQAMYFVDDNLPADADFARELFRALKKYRVPFGMQARVEFSMDERDLALAKEAGCTLISSGYESVNQMSLNGTGKRASAEDYLQVIQNIFDAGIIPSGNWMFGFDWDTPDVFEKTLEFLDRSKLLHCSFTSEIPFPGTAAYRRYRSEGRIVTERYQDYIGKDRVVVKPKQMEVETLRDGIRWLAKRYYSPRRTLRRSLLSLKNPKLSPWSSAWVRTPALLGLNTYQTVQWHYRMLPRIRWAYDRLLPYYKYLHVQDWARQSNFWKRDHASPPPPSQPDLPDTPFLNRQGYKPTRRAPLLPLSGALPQAPHDPAGREA